MALTIENADIGYDVTNVADAIKRLQVQCIDETINMMRKNISNVEDALKNAWVGTSADRLYHNLDVDCLTVEHYLKESYETLEAELYAIVNKMDEYDSSIVKERNYQG